MTADRAFDVAVRFFQSAAYDLAEKELAEFIKNNPSSPRLPEAVLLEAQSLFQLKRYEQAEALLRERLGAAEKLSDQYQYWLAECLYALGRYTDAAAAFALAATGSSEPDVRLRAVLGEAYAAHQLSDFERVVALLGAPDGVFQKMSSERLEEEPVVKGFLLLGETLLTLSRPGAGVEHLSRLADAKLPDPLSWNVKLLLARMQKADQRLGVAIHTVTNLLSRLSVVTNATASSLRGDAVILEGELREAAGQTNAAITAYEANLTPTTPPDHRQRAVQQLVRLALAQGRIADAGRRLEAYVLQNPEDQTLDLLRLTLGELRLKEYYQLPPEGRNGDTNLLRLARTQFDHVVANTNNALAPKAHFHRGWCLWEEAQRPGKTNALSECLIAFGLATAALPRSEEQAIARFKWADSQFLLTNYAGAGTNYWLVATNYADLPNVVGTLEAQALYQLVRASLALGDQSGANEALRRLRARFPDDDLAERSLILYGQTLSRFGGPSQARTLFAEFLERSPESPQVPDVKLALARTHEWEGNWEEARKAYDEWCGAYTNHLSLPTAEFGRAWTTWRSGRETNAFNLFTNFVARFPENRVTPLAQYWIAENYYRHGDYVSAELNYKRASQNTNSPKGLSFEALIMAGRAAYSRQDYGEANVDFTKVINADDPEAPLFEAYFALADTFVRSAELSGTSVTNVSENFRQVRSAFERIIQNAPTNRLVPLAYGRLGNCYFSLALAVSDSKNYERATNAYHQVLKSDLVGVAERSEAAVGIAQSLERLAALAPPTDQASLFSEALKFYLFVVNGKVLREGEVADPFWSKVAAERAASLAQDQKQWDVAANLYKGLKVLAPSLTKMWDARLEKLSQLRADAEAANK